MLGAVDSGRPERFSALIAHKLSRLNIDIAALSEVRLNEEGSLREHGACYTLYWSGHSDNIISLPLPLHNKQHVVVLFSINAPTLQADPAEKEKFYTDLCHLIQKVPADKKIIVLGDFNARVGKKSEAWKGVLGKRGVGNCNNNGHLLPEFCAEQQLTITNTIFQQIV
ncbi:craniofacial development protein 2-like [Pitangus sulphuratus]|nr:craniofacial development protein 2-like [Pitangus sulphuratus]